MLTLDPTRETKITSTVTLPDCNDLLGADLRYFSLFLCQLCELVHCGRGVVAGFLSPNIICLLFVSSLVVWTMHCAVTARMVLEPDLLFVSMPVRAEHHPC
jgi:hypothetical protein